MNKKIIVLFIFLFLHLINTACAPMPTKSTAVLLFRNNWSFPFVILDFGSTAMAVVEINGEEIFKSGWLELPAGRHKVAVQITKGPTGFFGPAPLLGTCRAILDVEVEANQIYVIQFKREDKKEIVQIRAKSHERPLLTAPCVPAGKQ